MRSNNSTNNIDSTAISQNRLNSSSETPMLDFTEEESDAAIQRFGCDCLGCVNAILSMRGLLPVSIRSHFYAEKRSHCRADYQLSCNCAYKEPKVEM